MWDSLETVTLTSARNKKRNRWSRELAELGQQFPCNVTEGYLLHSKRESCGRNKCRAVDVRIAELCKKRLN